jgi:hypothetical protein
MPLTHFKIKWPISLLISVFCISCVTPAKKPRPRKQRPLIEKKQDVPKAKAEVTESSPTKAPPSIAEQFIFIKKYGRGEADFNREEHEFVSRLPNDPKPGSVKEAALLIGLVESIIHPIGRQIPTFVETDITDSKAAPPPQGISLETVCKERGLDLVGALRNNHHLQSHGVASQVVLAMGRGENSEDFKTAVLNLLNEKSGRWSNLKDTIALMLNPKQEVLPSIEEEEDEAPPSPADLRDDDTILVEAQALADRGKHRAAIKILGYVDESSALYQGAKDKIKEFSDTAVQTLRRKAALAFQSARPLSDVETRAAYLRQAKQYLEQAIENYPDAAQLPTVRDNLRVISRDLERIQEKQ